MTPGDAGGVHPALRPGRLTVGILGAGRVGAPLGAALSLAGHRVVAASGVSESSVSRIETLLPGVPRVAAQDVVAAAELVFVTVPDDQIEPVVAGLAAMGAWRQGQLVAHCAGTLGLGALDAAAAAGAIPLALHPAMTFTGTSLDLDRMVGAAFAVTAPGPFVPIAQALVVEVGGEPLVIDDAARPLYHAALVHGANHVAALVTQAAGLLAAAGIDDPARVLGPLVRASIDGALADAPGSAASLTGPVVRADAGTLAAHAAALRGRGEAWRAYRAMALATATVAAQAGRIGPADVAAVVAALGQE